MGSFSPTNYNYGEDFYKDAFEISEIGTQEVYTLLENQNSMMNQILYRYNPGSEDYEENTFLDMFIFQAGAKNNKPVYSLEDLEDVIKLSIRAMTPDKDKKKDNDNNAYLDKNSEMKFVMLEEAYRRGDLDQIDSLSKADNPTQVYHKYFIVERNRNIVNRMDSLMQVHSMFTGIGAAHLPGDEGAIELLREKGYTVEAVSPKSTGKSHKMRKKFSKMYKAVPFSPTTLADNFVTVSVPGELCEMPTISRGRMEYFCPEPINGGYFSVIRLFTYAPLYNRQPEFYKATFDSLLYIATPGELLAKEEIEVNGHMGYQILTQTSKNSLVNYRVFFTPTEVIIFKGSGNGKYIEKAEPQTFFNKIQLAENSSEWHDVSPLYGGASWKMKGLVTGQDLIEDLDDSEADPLYHSYDSETGDYFMVMRYTFNDLDYIEEDSFDLAYLGSTFAEERGFKVDESKEFELDGKLIIEQSMSPENKNSQLVSNLKCRIIAKAGLYYMMVAAANETNTQTFFNSFKFTDFKIDKERFDTYTDSAFSYTVTTISPEEEVDYLAYAFSIYKDSYEEEEDNSFMSDSKNTSHFLPETNEGIYVGYTKFHDYDEAISEEDFWDYQIEQYDGDNYFIVSRKEKGEKNGDQTLSFLFTDTNSTRGILTKFHLHGGVLYSLQALIDTIDGPSEYVSTFFDTFEPMDTLIGRDVFEDKAQLFYDHAMGTDSLNRVNAIKSINNIDFEEEDIDKVIEVYKNYEFDKETETEDREDLIMRLGGLEDPKAYTFLEETFQENSFDSDLQFICLKSFSYTESEEAYDAIKKLLINNTPVTDQKRKLNFFNNLYDSLELAEDYFPELLDVGVSYPEYKPWLIELLAWGYVDSIYTTKNFTAKADIIKKEAMIELKREIADQEKNEESGKKKNSYYGQYSLNGSYHTILIDYYILMQGLKKAGVKGTDQFFEGIKKVNNSKFKVECEIINHRLGLDVDKEVIAEVAGDLDYRVWTYNRLDKKEMLDFYPDSISQQDIAMGILYINDYDEEEDSLEFLEKQYINNGVDTGYVYFFKRKREDEQYWTIDYVGIQPVDEGKFSTVDQSSKKGLAFKNEDEIQETIDKTMDIFLYEHRLRVVISTGYEWDFSSLFGY